MQHGGNNRQGKTCSCRVNDLVLEIRGIAGHARRFGISFGLLEFYISIQAQKRRKYQEKLLE